MLANISNYASVLLANLPLYAFLMIFSYSGPIGTSLPESIESFSCTRRTPFFCFSDKLGKVVTCYGYNNYSASCYFYCIFTYIFLKYVSFKMGFS